MKKFLTLCAALCCSAMAFAQFPSSANWTEGQDISKDLADQGLWGDYSGTWEAGGVVNDGAVTQTPNPSPWWKGDQPDELALTATSDPETNPYPCVGFYRNGAGGSLPDMYQIIPLPKGYYEVKVNAVYREGTPADTWTSYAAGNPKRNAHLYVNTLTSEDPEAILASYDRPINTLPFSIIKDGARYTGEDSGTSWKTDGKYTWTKDGVEDSCFYPCCDEGAALHFKEGNYEHSLKFILLEDGYIRLGLKKSANISQDWFPWANMRIIYQGVADEDAQIDLAFEAYGDALDQIEALKERIENEGFGALYAMLDDAQMEIEDAVEETLESANESTAKLLALREQFEAAFASAKALGDLISMSDDMAVATDFPTHAEFEEAIEAAKAVAFAEDPADINYDPANYTAAFNALSAARANYLDSQDFDEDGNKDFTMLIKYPWFVNAEYNPEYLPVDGNEATKAWQLTEATWADRGALGNPGNYVDKVGGRTNIASKVVLSADVEATNQWFKRVNYDGWSPGLQLYYQSCLVGPSSGWNSISGGSEEICQQLVGLPNGYYSLRALMRGDNGAGWTAPDGEKTFHNIYAMNSDSTYVKSEPNATKEEANNNMSNGWYEWNPLAWTEHRTGIIQVSDGKLLIAAQTTNVMNATGFRLYFHGANPQFDNMIQPDIEAVQEKALQLTFEGDKTYVQGLLDQIVLPIGTDATIYEADLAIIKQANEYIKAALDATSDKNFTAPSDFVALQGKYAADADQFAMLQLPTDYAIALGTNEGDTYDMAPAANKLYKAYEAYFAIYDKALNYQTQEVATVIAEQTEYLKANMATVELLEEYTAALAGPMNQAIFNELAAFDATEENPVNITSLLVNPQLTKSPTEGWTCAEATPSINTYGRGNAELWNASAFDLYQEIKYLPAGKYEFRARALYRDAAAVDSAHYADYKAAGDEAAWKNHNALIYANNGKADQSNYIKAVHSAQKTEPSFTSWYNMEGFDEYTNAGFVSNWNGNVCIFEDELFDEHKNDLETLADCVVNMGDDYDEKCHGENIFDTPIVDGETTYYFPSSMAGFYFLLQNDKEVYNNSVKTVLPEGNTLRVGLKKTAAIGSDWVIYDDFELYYLGPEDFVDEPNNEYNLIADDASFGFNDGTVGQWHYLGWNNGGTATNVAPGYGNSAGAMALTSTNPAGDPWGAQLLCSLKEGAKLER
ncbi:MAG: hypothetical protein KBS99_07095, partial [Prevotellaceae bacterium]|nr:hypothetical protein [Candidatus Colivivens caballi]